MFYKLDGAGWLTDRSPALAASPGGTREWGVCTECGMGRAGREEMPVLLDLHRQMLAGGRLARA